MKNLLITICARGGSKGIPGKNIKLINNKPLIAYTINHANLFKKWLEDNFDHTIIIELSTDSNKIKEVATEYNLYTKYTRSEDLSNDKAGKLDAISDLILYSELENKIKYDIILDLDVSAPMRTLEDLKRAYKILLEDSASENLFSVNKAHKNPYFNMVELNKEGYYSLSKSSGLILSRQTAPDVYEMNASFYFYKRSFFDKETLNLFNKSLIFEMEHESFDLDDILDFEFLDYLMKNKKLTYDI